MNRIAPHRMAEPAISRSLLSSCKSCSSCQKALLHVLKIEVSLHRPRENPSPRPPRAYCPRCRNDLRLLLPRLEYEAGCFCRGAPRALLRQPKNQSPFRGCAVDSACFASPPRVRRPMPDYRYAHPRSDHPSSSGRRLHRRRPRPPLRRDRTDHFGLFPGPRLESHRSRGLRPRNINQSHGALMPTSPA